MSEKHRILDTLGEKRLIVPSLVNRGLAANDRAKYYLTLLQMAAATVDREPGERPDLSRERIACGEADGALDGALAAVRRVDGERLALPGAAVLFDRLRTALKEMLAPLAAAGDGDAAAFSARLEALFREAWCDAGDVVTTAAIERAARGTDREADSPHLLVMDLHKALNRLQAAYATESLDGARAYLIAAEDRPLVAAFMRGVQRTRWVKFDHPGLETTATRSGTRLVLQNDIGTTDAHVLVVHVEGQAATVTYTDVHLPRLLFFQSLLERWPLKWNDTLSRSDATFEDGVYHLVVGSFDAPDRAALASYLEYLGSRLVFLIDWNRARKRLRLLLGKKDAAALLKWAADEEIGHMAFLRIGGEQVVYDTLASLGKTPAAFGARLDDVLGRDAAVDYLRFVFRAAADALRDGRPESLVHDEIRAELMGSLLSARQTVLDYASEQISLGIEIAASVRDSLLGGGAGAEAAARRAKDWERRADELVNLARELGRRSEHATELSRLVEQGDNTVDALEEAAFHLSLLASERAGARVLRPLVALAELALHAAQEYLKAVEGARALGHGAPRADMQDFLEAVHRIVDLEHRGDEAERGVHLELVRGGADARDLFVVVEVARGLEGATDWLKHTALALRDQVLGNVMAA